MIESVLNKIFQYIYQKRSSQHFDIILWPPSRATKMFQVHPPLAGTCLRMKNDLARA